MPSIRYVMCLERRLVGLFDVARTSPFTASNVHHIVDLLLAPHPETVVEALGAGILFAGRPQDTRIAPLLGEPTDAVDELLADPRPSARRP